MMVSQRTKSDYHRCASETQLKTTVCCSKASHKKVEIECNLAASASHHSSRKRMTQMNQTTMRSHLRKNQRRSRSRSKVQISGQISPKADGQWSRKRRLNWLQLSSKAYRKK